MKFYSASAPWLYLAVPIILLAVFFFIPVGWAFQISLLDYGHSIVTPGFVGMKNYAYLLHNEHFWQVMLNTALFMVMVVPAMVTLPILMAMLLNNSLKGMALFRALIYLPVVISLVVAGIAFKWVYDSNGILNYLLGLIGLPKVGWLVSPDIALWAVAIMVVWKGLAYYMMMYLASLQSMSSELYEAAEIDGATMLQRHWYLTLPHLRPTMALVALISVIGALKVFTEIYVMTRGGPVGSTETFVYYIYDQAFANLNLGTASAAGFLLMLIVFALSLLNIRFFYLKAEKEAAYA